MKTIYYFCPQNINKQFPCVQYTSTFFLYSSTNITHVQYQQTNNKDKKKHIDITNHQQQQTKKNKNQEPARLQVMSCEFLSLDVDGLPLTGPKRD